LRLTDRLPAGTPWTILESTAFVEIESRYNFGRVVYAVGLVFFLVSFTSKIIKTTRWDAASVLLKVLDLGDK
jgi:hypothetical protein